jgi:hypothetical protein
MQELKSRRLNNSKIQDRVDIALSELIQTLESSMPSSEVAKNNSVLETYKDLWIRVYVFKKR